MNGLLEAEQTSNLNRAIFGFARVDLLRPLRPINQGEFNQRPINKKAVDQLVQNMETVGVHSDRYSTAIPLLANPDDIDPSSLLLDITKISQAKDLVLSEKGEADVKSFSAAGGRHRTKALEIVVERVDKEMKGIQDRINNTKKRESSKGKAKLERLREELKKCKAKKAGLRKWTVILYDEGKYT